MPDKKYDELAEKGWAMMSTTLDKEMPEKKDRRWIIFFLLFVTIGLGAGGAYLFTKKGGDLKYDVSEIDEVVYQEKQHIALKSTDNSTPAGSDKVEFRMSDDYKIAEEEAGFVEGIEADDLNKDENLERDELINENAEGDLEENDFVEDKSTNVVDTATDVKRRQEVFANKRGNTIVTKGTDVNRTPEVSLLIENQERVLEIIESRIKEVPDIESSRKSLKANSGDLRVIAEKPTLPGINSLKALPFPSFISDDEGLHSPKIIQVESRRPIAYKAIAGLGLPIGASAQYYFLSLGIEKQITKRYAVELGIGGLWRFKGIQFSQLDRDDYVFEVGDVTVVDIPNQFTGLDNEVLVTSSNEVQEKYYDLVSEKLSSSLYVDAQLSVSYQLAHRHQVGGGFRYGYLIEAKNEIIYLAELEPSLASDSGNLGFNALIEANAINKHNFALTGRYRFQLSRRIGLLADATFGLNDIIRTNRSSELDNRINFIGIGMDYKLKM